MLAAPPAAIRALAAAGAARGTPHRRGPVVECRPVLLWRSKRLISVAGGAAYAAAPSPPPPSGATCAPRGRRRSGTRSCGRRWGRLPGRRRSSSPRCGRAGGPLGWRPCVMQAKGGCDGGGSGTEFGTWCWGITGGSLAGCMRVAIHKGPRTRLTAGLLNFPTPWVGASAACKGNKH